MNQVATSDLPSHTRFCVLTNVRPLLTLVTLGLIGIVAQLPVLIPMLETFLATHPDAPNLSLTTITALSLINPLILLVISVMIGLLVTPRVGLISHVVNWLRSGKETPVPFAVEIPIAVLAGTVAGALIIIVDTLAGGYLPDRSLGYTVAGIFYGGITEEILMRWGLMSLIAWLLVKLLRQAGTPSTSIMWSSVIASALLFGALHLPYAATLYPLTPELVLLILLLNGMGGLVFGWLYWKKSLEAAMIAHAVCHLTMTALAFLL